MNAVDDSTTALARAKAGELLGAHDLMTIFRLKPSRFYELKHRGDFDRFLVDKPIGRAIYAGARVYRYTLGEIVDRPTFGRKKASA